MSVEQEVLELRGRVSRLEAQVEFLYKKLNLEYVTEPSTVNPRILEMIQKGNLIEAIKIYREVHDVGLTEAKQAVEEIKARAGY